jgi:hypothetical protein
MANIEHAIVFRGNSLRALGDFQTAFEMPALCDGDIVEVRLECDSVSDFADDWYIGLKVDGTPELAGADRLHVQAANLTPSTTGLSIPVLRGEYIKPYVETKGGGSINGPIAVIVMVRPTAKTTPDDADDFGFTDSVDGKPKRLSWANIKSVLNGLFVMLTGNQTINGIKTFISSPQVPTPIGSTDAVNKSYADALAAGLSWKQAVRAATTANGTLATAFANGQTIDGVVLATGDRILIKDQTTASENGIYVVQAAGAPVRATDADSGAELVNASVVVSEGTLNADKSWTCSTNAPIVPGTTALTFAPFNAGAAVSDGDKGDVVVSGTGSVWTIDNKVVTYSKIQDVSATSRFLGRITAGAGDIEELTPTQATSLLNAFTSLLKGLVPASGGGTVNFLRADGVFAAPPTVGLTYTEVTGTAASMSVNNGYIANNGALVTLTLPTTAAVGDVIPIVGSGAGGWRIAQNASQVIKWTSGGVAGTNETTTGATGHLDSADRFDSVELICIAANTTWGVRLAKGNPTLT